MTQTAAYFYAAQGDAAPRVEFCLLCDGRRQRVASLSVTGKRQARAEAKRFGFTPWNF